MMSCLCRCSSAIFFLFLLSISTSIIEREVLQEATVGLFVVVAVKWMANSKPKEMQKDDEENFNTIIIIENLLLLQLTFHPIHLSIDLSAAMCHVSRM